MLNATTSIISTTLCKDSIQTFNDIKYKKNKYYNYINGYSHKHN
jgi:hypothetical protein